MALTEIKTSGIADDAVTTDKLANAINTERTANTAKPSLANDANNRVVTGDGSGGLNGEANLTFDGSTLEVSSSTPATVKINDTGGYQGYIQMRGNDLEIRGSSGQIEFYQGNADGASSSEKFRISSHGGVTFNGDTAAANCLSDYEEGTWTPVAETGTVSATYAKYIKIGSMVTLFVDLYNFSDTSSTNDILVSLPFAGITNEEAAGAVHGERVDTSLLVSYINSAAYLGFRNGVGSSNYSYIRHNAITDGGDCNIKTVISYLTAS